MNGQLSIFDADETPQRVRIKAGDLIEDGSPLVGSRLEWLDACKMIGRVILYKQVLQSLTYKRIVELMNADTEGRLIVLPCKVGDIVYWNTGLAIHEYPVQGFIIDQENKFRLDLGDFQPVYPWKNHVFFNREEAERALEEAQE